MIITCIFQFRLNGGICKCPKPPTNRGLCFEHYMKLRLRVHKNWRERQIDKHGIADKVTMFLQGDNDDFTF